MSFRRLRRSCEQRLSGLDLPELRDIDTFCDALARRRGRRILRVPIAAPGTGIWGMWVATANADVIFFQGSTTPLHREHIVLHEVSHMLCDHQPSAATPADWAPMLLPSLDPAMVRRVLARSGYHEQQEREAELLASLILERARPAGDPRALTRSADVHSRDLL